MNIDYSDFGKNILTRDAEGNFYRLKIENDDWADSPREWDNLGHMICWHRNYNLGDGHNYSDPEDMWRDLVRKYISGDDLIQYALSGKGSVLLEKVKDEDGEESYELYWYGYISFCSEKQSPSWCLEKVYDTDNLDDLKSGWYLEDDIIDNLSISDCETLLEGKVFYYPLYLYDHSGITMSIGSFGDPWDSGQVGWIYCTKDDIEKEYNSFTQKDIDTAMSVMESEVEVYDQYLRGDVYWYSRDSFIGGKIGDESVRPEDVLEDDCFWRTEDSCGGFFGDDVETNGMSEYWPEGLEAV